MTIESDAILRGWRDPTTGLWRVPLDKHTPPTKSKYVILDADTTENLQNLYELPATAEIVCYLHVCAGFSANATWLTAIKG